MKLDFRIDFGYLYLYSRHHYHPFYVWDGSLTCKGGTTEKTWRLDYPVIWYGPGNCAKETPLSGPEWKCTTHRGIAGVRFAADVAEDAVFTLHTETMGAVYAFDPDPHTLKLPPAKSFGHAGGTVTPHVSCF